jgi:hypothetical protein
LTFTLFDGVHIAAQAGMCKLFLYWPYVKHQQVHVRCPICFTTQRRHVHIYLSTLTIMTHGVVVALSVQVCSGRFAFDAGYKQA